MRNPLGLAAGLLLLATALQAQQPQAQQPQGQQPQAQPQAQQPEQKPTPYQPPMVIHRIDLVPTGSIFSMDKPKLEGDFYVFRILPERTVERLRKDKVKRIVQRSRDFDKEVVWQVDLLPEGKILASDEPVKKGSAYVLHSFKGGTLMSVSQKDVAKITKLTGIEAFKAEELELGVTVMTGGEPNFRSDTAGEARPAPGRDGASQSGGSAPPPGATPGSEPA